MAWHLPADARQKMVLEGEGVAMLGAKDSSLGETEAKFCEHTIPNQTIIEQIIGFISETEARF